MKYLVMECKEDKAIVLDEEGRFLTVRNNGLTEGMTVEEIIPVAQKNKKALFMSWTAAIATIAACFVFVAVILLNSGNKIDVVPGTYATVHLSINPDVSIDIDKDENVLDLRGDNEDGISLCNNVVYSGKKLDTVADELMEYAIELGFLKSGDGVNLSVDCDDDTPAEHIYNIMEVFFEGKLSVRLALYDKDGNEIRSIVTAEDKETTISETAPETAPATTPVNSSDDDKEQTKETTTPAATTTTDKTTATTTTKAETTVTTTATTPRPTTTTAPKPVTTDDDNDDDNDRPATTTTKATTTTTKITTTKPTPRPTTTTTPAPVISDDDDDNSDYSSDDDDDNSDYSSDDDNDDDSSDDDTDYDD